MVLRTEIDPQFDSALAAGLSQIFHHVTLASAPGNIPDAVIGGFGLPQAEPAFVLGYENDVLRTDRLGSGNPLIGVELVRIDFLQGRVKRGILFLVLPRLQSDANHHSKLTLLPGRLLRRGPGQFPDQRLRDDARSGCE